MLFVLLCTLCANVFGISGVGSNIGVVTNPSIHPDNYGRRLNTVSARRRSSLLVEELEELIQLEREMRANEDESSNESEYESESVMELSAMSDQSLAAEEQELCTTVTNYFGQNVFKKAMKLLMNAKHGKKKRVNKRIAKRVAKWCKRQQPESRRRMKNRSQLFEQQYDEMLYAQSYHRDMKAYGIQPRKVSRDDGEAFWDAMVAFANNTEWQRRRQDSGYGVLTRAGWQSCDLYATFTSKIMEHLVAQGAASFLLESTGDELEKLLACGAIVNSVNGAIVGGLLPGISVQTLNDEQVAVAKSEAVLKDYGLSVDDLPNFQVVTAATQGVLGFTGVILMTLCSSYKYMARLA